MTPRRRRGCCWRAARAFEQAGDVRRPSASATRRCSTIRTRPTCCGCGRAWPRDAANSTTRTRCGRTWRRRCRAPTSARPTARPPPSGRWPAAASCPRWRARRSRPVRRARSRRPRKRLRVGAPGDVANALAEAGRGMGGALGAALLDHAARCREAARDRVAAVSERAEAAKLDPYAPRVAAGAPAGRGARGRSQGAACCSTSSAPGRRACCRPPSRAGAPRSRAASATRSAPPCCARGWRP